VRSGATIPIGLREAHLTHNFRNIVSKYAFPSWAGKAVLFRAKTTWPIYAPANDAYGWDATVRGGVEVVWVDGDHHSLLRGTNAAPLARALQTAIDAVTPSPHRSAG
jgi:thioesterase domain-containing protein